MKVYLLDRATPAQIEAVGARLREDEDVAEVRYLSKEEALARMKRKYPDLTRNLVFNPLPNSFEIVPRDAAGGADIAERLLPKPPGVDSVKFSRFFCARARS